MKHQFKQVKAEKKKKLYLWELLRIKIAKAWSEMVEQVKGIEKSNISRFLKWKMENANRENLNTLQVLNDLLLSYLSDLLLQHKY